MSENAVIEVQNLKKYFKDVKAVDDISFRAEEGELIGFLGENGAGKSTTINMMCTLFRPTGGEIRICGFRVGKEDKDIRDVIGVVWQNNCLDEKLTVKENLEVRGAMYGFSGKRLEGAVERVREKLHLQDIMKRPYGKMSGGQKRRCEIAAALIHTPRILFLDEPTTGLDPATRKLVWESIDALRKEEHTTIFLTTHYMEEAEKADRIIIMDKGKIKEQDTPFALKEHYTYDRLRLFAKPGMANEIKSAVGKDEKGEERAVGNDTLLTVALKNSLEAIEILKRTEQAIEGFELVRGTMDDVFLSLTGREFEVS